MTAFRMNHQLNVCRYQHLPGKIRNITVITDKLLNLHQLIAEATSRTSGFYWVKVTALLMLFPGIVLAHGVASSDQSYISTGEGRMLFAYLYLGAKHMITGYDHLLFLVGVVFYLYRLRDVGIYVTLFAIGHSITMLSGVLGNIAINAHLIDAIIGFSVVYKAADNLGLWDKWFGWSPDPKVATFVFGLLHGFGLATKVQEYAIPDNGLLENLLAFNIGVEIGQLLALGMILILMGFWRRSARFWPQAQWANKVLIVAGFALMAYQLLNYLHIV